MRPIYLQPQNFAHLHVHSVFSIQDGMIPIKKLVEFGKKFDQKVVAVTDHGSLCGFWQLYTECRKQKMLPMFGCEFYINNNRSLIENREFHLDRIEKENRQALQKVIRKYHHLIAWALNKKGYQNILAIQNDAWMNGFYYKPTTDLDSVFAHAEGLAVSTACFAGEIPQLLFRGNYGAAKYLTARFKEAFGDRFFIELMLNNFPLQKSINESLIRLAAEMRVPTIFTGDAHYYVPGDAALHKVVLNMGKRGGDNSNATWEFDTNDLYLKSLNEFYDEWNAAHRSEIFTESVFRSCLENIHAITSWVEPIFLESTPRIPSYPDEWNELLKRSTAGFQDKLRRGMIPVERIKEYQERLVFELKVIRTMQAISYMLLFSDVVRFCDDPKNPDLWKEGLIPPEIDAMLPEEGKILRGTGRGSVGGSLVAWLLNITQGVDPLRFDLLFERFLDVNRVPKMELGL
jgi:DNA polymerase-3 subunit alpha